ncbi:thymidylate kinase [Streptomyces sp. FXJ1.172]|uniref:dTMP kinase n=1 Tax=Streptomyces sp. FXJ1.172 TaxID=710705 RepID=UPI00078E62B9|nr:thymidylate kinase [Streptomyces sp. FXJ1.172]AMR44314.1 thymidylate kinase [Streptomyces sp. FXJ1.172]WEO92674.1 thymidylate kinase [Streptomyces sp. FXJ1.172]
MTGDRNGFFVSIDGPSGVGKSTTIRELQALLSARGVPAQWTVEPPRGDFLGDFTRTHGGQLHGMALACLVAAARYRHVETTIDPALSRGELLISDRYMASTLVLQKLDGVPMDFLLLLNDYAPKPDLAVILTASPGTIADRITKAGITHRFRADPEAPAREVELYRDAANLLEDLRAKVLVIDSTAIPPSEVARRIADALPAMPLPSDASAITPTPQES